MYTQALGGNPATFVDKKPRTYPCARDPQPCAMGHWTQCESDIAIMRILVSFCCSLEVLLLLLHHC